MTEATMPPGFWQRLRGLLWPEPVPTSRSFVTGPAVVEQHDRYFGHETETFSPEIYGNYLATSSNVYVCAQLRAKLLASLPLRLYQLQQGNRDLVESGELYELLQKVNPRWTFRRLVEMTELSLCLWGVGYWFADRGQGGRGRPRELWWARPDRVRVIPHPTDYVSGFIYRPANSTTDLYFTPQETIWLRYPNPIDEYAGLSPLAAARLSADTSTAAMKSNRNIFTNGSNMAGLVTPGSPDRQFSDDQGNELTELLRKRFKGTDNAHRIAVLAYEARFQQVSMSPKDAEYLGQMKWSLEDICRVYGIPLDLVGGQRTYENAESARRAIWEHTLVPEATFLSDELTEQLLPMFAGQADLAEFDTSEVDVLKEGEDARWERWRSQIERGARTVNEYRDEIGEPHLEWGDAWWAPFNLTPIDPTTGQPPQVTVSVEDAPPDPEIAALPASTDGDDDIAIAPARFRRLIDYGSSEHEARWRMLLSRTSPHEGRVQRTVADLFRRQRSSFVGKLKQQERGVRALDVDELLALFGLARWTKTFRGEMRPVLRSIIEDAGTAALDELAVGVSFDVADPNVVRFLERQSQRFAREVNATTWDALKDSLSEGIIAGEGIDDLAKRVEDVMGLRIRSSAETIGRTETTAAWSGGNQLSYEQSGVVWGRQWLAALDDRTRESHVHAHGQVAKLGEPFIVGGSRGMGPGLMDEASESVNCRCSTLAILEGP